MSDINPIPSGQMPQKFMEQETEAFLITEWKRIINTHLATKGEASLLVSYDAPWQRGVLMHYANLDGHRALRQECPSRYAELWKVEKVNA